jgi:hypothetical protein
MLSPAMQQVSNVLRIVVNVLLLGIPSLLRWAAGRKVSPANGEQPRQGTAEAEPVSEQPHPPSGG